ncbi:MAG: NADPH-dependent FMN reductase [Thermoplasmata archaeon]
MTETVRIVGISGSLRKASFNRMLLRNAQELVPSGSSLEVVEIPELPGFNQDLEQSPPATLAPFKAKIRAADAILFATPEYNYSIPGALKNAIDWASRPYGDNAWNDKPVAAIGASIGLLGASRAIYHLRQSFIFLNMHPINLPEVFVAFADKKFDAEGRFTDEAGRKILAALLATLVESTARWGRR